MTADLRDLIDGTLLRRAVVPDEPVKRTCETCGTIGCDHTNTRRCGAGFWDWTPKTPQKKRTQSDRMRELRTMREEMRQRGEIK